MARADETRPILVIPYMWIGDFVRCHSVVQVLKSRWPHRPVDMLATPLTAPLVDYMPGVRRAVISDLPRGRLALREQWRLAKRVRGENYGAALVMPRTWKSALLPFLAGIPVRTGWLGEARFLLLNDARRGERRLPRMVDQCAALALPPDVSLPAEWPAPELKVPPAELARWRARRGVDNRPAVALAPGAVGPSKRWTASGYAEVASALAKEGFAVWVLGGPSEGELAREIAAHSGGAARDLTGSDLRDAVLALGSASAVISNDSGLLHVAAALCPATVGIFGPTSPWHWAPLNGLAGTIKVEPQLECQPCHQPVCALQHHRCMREISSKQVLAVVDRVLAKSASALVI